MAITAIVAAEFLGAGMPRFMISFDDGAMDHFADADWPHVGEASRAVVRDARAAGVWIFGGGFLRQISTVIAPDGTQSTGPAYGAKAELGGFSIIDVATRAEALDWAARIAKACRCPQHVREIMHDPES